MTKDEFCIYVKAVLDMEVEIAKITHKTKIDNIELNGALKLIGEALNKVDKTLNIGAPTQPIGIPTIPLNPNDWVITCGVSNEYDNRGTRAAWETNTSNT